MLKRIEKLMLVVALLSIAACSKDEFTQTGAINQAPAPSTGPYTPPSGYQYPGQTPVSGQPYYYPQQMPQNLPSQYTPFMPIDNYMRSRPPLQQYWGQFWGQWVQYANYYGYDRYDFPTFWFEYCPQQWQDTRYAQLYDYFDSNVYFWVNWDTQFDYSVDSNYFWYNYRGMPYQQVDNYGYCNSYCNSY